MALKPPENFLEFKKTPRPEVSKELGAIAACDIARGIDPDLRDQVYQGYSSLIETVRPGGSMHDNTQFREYRKIVKDSPYIRGCQKIDLLQK
jgi:hypothetical protein